MTRLVTVKPLNGVHMKVLCEPDVANEIYGAFSFYAPNYKFQPKYKAGRWDGKINLFDKRNRQLYVGLREELEAWCNKQGYEFEDHVVGNLEYRNVGRKTVMAFIGMLNLPFTPHDYQVEALLKIIRAQRAICLSPTSSGKSLIQYMACRWFADKKFLVIVPNIGLVGQLAEDFKDYGYNSNVYQIKAGVDKGNIKERITVTTWHSVAKQSPEWFDQFDAIMGDEAHTFQAKSLVDIMGKCLHQSVRIGLSGTLQEEESCQMTLRGLFGPTFRTVTSRELMDAGHAAEVVINAVSLTYPLSFIKEFKAAKHDYPSERNVIACYEPRQHFIAKLATSLPGNKMVLFKGVDHGKALYDKIAAINGVDKTFLIFGDVKADARNDVRKIMEDNDGVIAVASFKTFATGTNIKNLQFMVFTEGGKSIITILQAVGRAMRLSHDKKSAIVIDIGDKIVNLKTKQNFAWKHFIRRLEIYAKDKFKIKMKEYILSEQESEAAGLDVSQWDEDRRNYAASGKG